MFPRYWSLMTSQKGNDISQQNQGGQQGGQQQNPGQQLRSPDRADSKVAAASRSRASRIKISSSP